MIEPIRILLIEDDALDAEFVERAMKFVSFSYEITWATNLTTAIRLAANQNFNVVLSDLSLPDSVGQQTVEKLVLNLPQSPIVVLTCSNELALAERILDVGAQDYIPKEAISGDVLGRAIRYAIQRHSNLLETKNLLRELNLARDLLTTKNNKLEQLYRQAHDFVDNVSHEFRTPLTVIKEYSSLIREGFAGAINNEQIHMLNIIENRVDDLNTMVDDMLDSSKLEAGLIGVWRKPCSASEILDHVTAAMDRKAQIKGVKLIWEIADDLPDLFCDAEKIGRVLINLGVNALKFCGNPGEVRLQIHQNESNTDVTFLIEDNGVGIDTEDLKRIFERFRQVGATAHSSNKGFGLGLAIAKELVDINFGTLSVSSEIGCGSKFYFTLPTNDPTVVVTRYLEYIRRSIACPKMITLVMARSDTNGNPETLDAIDDFLSSVCRSNDLLFRCPDGGLLLILATGDIELQPFLDRGQQAWASINRNCPRGPLPAIAYDCLGTWQVNDSQEDLIRIVAELTCSNEVACA